MAEDYDIDGNELEVRVNSPGSQGFDYLREYIGIYLEKSANLYNLIIDKAREFKANWVYSFEALGKDGKPFIASKIRTMEGRAKPGDYKNVDSLGKPMNSNSRVIPNRKWLRRNHPDEILNLINVLKGDMKFVGVRPKPRENWEEHYTKEEMELLLTEKPGLNGVPYAKPWQDRKKTELEYNKEQKEEPGLTEIKYFFDIWYNKLVKGHRGH